MAEAMLSHKWDGAWCRRLIRRTHYLETARQADGPLGQPCIGALALVQLVGQALRLGTK